MRIVCDNCSAKYQISDEKVRNKVFKIRCKRCSHVIIVRANEQPAEAPQPEAAESTQDETRVSDFGSGAAASNEAPAADATWYVVINREQVGPLTRDQVDQHFRAGEVDGDAFTWCEGMADWMRLAAIPEFAHLFPAAAPVAESTASAAVAAAEAAAAAAEPDAAVFGGAAAPAGGDDDVMVSNNASTGSSESLFGGDGGGYDSPRVDGADDFALRNQRNENSVLFSLDSLSADAEAVAAPRVSNTGGPEGSGLIDISALGGGGPAVAPVASPAMDFGSAPAFGGAPAFAPTAPAGGGGAMPSLVARRGNNTAKIAMIVMLAVLVVAGGGLGAYFAFFKKDPVEKPTVAQNDVTPAKATVPSAQPKPEAAKPVAAAPAGEKPAAAPAGEPPAAPSGEKPAAEPAGEKPAVAAASPKRRRRPRPRPSRATPSEDAPPPPSAARAAPPPPAPAPARRPRAKPKRGGDEVDELLGALDGNGGGSSRRGGRAPARPAAAAAPAADPSLPEQLGRRQILTVVKKNASAVRGCKASQPGVSGTIAVKLKIAKNGRVNSAQIVTGKFKGTPVGNCVAGKVRAFRFPQFSGDPMGITLPFAL